jgi:hypothetical protein
MLIVKHEQEVFFLCKDLLLNHYLSVSHNKMHFSHHLMVIVLHMKLQRNLCLREQVGKSYDVVQSQTEKSSAEVFSWPVDSL